MQLLLQHQWFDCEYGTKPYRLVDHPFLKEALSSVNSGSVFLLFTSTLLGLAVVMKKVTLLLNVTAKSFLIIWPLIFKYISCSTIVSSFVNSSLDHR